MRTKKTATLAGAALLIGGIGILVAQEKRQTPGQTQMDLAGDYNNYYGQKPNKFKDPSRYLAKVDLDGDLNYDGEVSNTDPADGGAFEQTPPGLIVGAGEMTKLVIRIRPYRVDFKGDAVVALEAAGINRNVRSGKFAEGEAATGMGHIRVWLSPQKREEDLLIDTQQGLFKREWRLERVPPQIAALSDEAQGADLLPVPRTVYVEGVSPSPKHPGDIRLLLKVFHDDKERTGINPKFRLSSNVVTFRPSYDHILFTVTREPRRKSFINENSDGVWR